MIGHPGYKNMITILRKDFYWPNIKNDTAEYVAKCLEFQQVKASHQYPASLLQPLRIPEWTWETISMDFITRLPRTMKKHDSIPGVV